MHVWQVIKNGVREFFSPLLHLVARRKRPPRFPPGEMSPDDFTVPLRDAVLRRLEVWGPLLIMLLAGVVILATIWWLNHR